LNSKIPELRAQFRMSPWLLGAAIGGVYTTYVGEDQKCVLDMSGEGYEDNNFSTLTRVMGF